MSEITERQAEHLQTLLNEQGITQAQLASELGFSTTSVNRWARGKARMRDDSANLIHKRWPEYSVEWLQGGMGASERIDEIQRKITSIKADSKQLEDAVVALIESARYSYEDVSQDKPVAAASHDGGDSAKQLWFCTHSQHKIAKGGCEVVLDGTQWGLLLQETRQYIDMRIGFMMTADVLRRPVTHDAS